MIGEAGVCVGLCHASLGRRLLCVLAVLAQAGCRPPEGGNPAACEQLGIVRALPIANHHLGACDDPTCGNGLNPPTGGPHCATPLPCRQYDVEQPRCAWIHNLEHGHAVLAYNCPEGCPELVTELEQLRNETLPASDGVRRILITPDSNLPQRFAVVVWGWSYSADEVNRDAVACVLAHQDEDAPEPRIACEP